MKWFQEKWAWLKNYLNKTIFEKVHKLWHTVIDNVTSWVDTSMKTVNQIISSPWKIAVVVVVSVYVLDLVLLGRLHAWEVTGSALAQFAEIIKLGGGWLLGIVAIGAYIYVEKIRSKK